MSTCTSKTLFTFFNLILILLVTYTNGFAIEMIPIDSPHLKIIRSNLTFDERHRLLANISLSRVVSVRNKLEGLGPNSFQSENKRLHSGYYLTRLNIGRFPNPNRPGTARPHKALLLLDTGSDETWVQCDRCNPCFHVVGGNFAYARSRTFRQVPIHDNLCVPSMVYEGSCGYEIQYFGESNTVGFIGRDTFYFRDTRTGKMSQHTDLAFGCGLRNIMEFWDTDMSENEIAGIHGIARGPRSFMNQLSNQINGRFSYCLTSLAEAQSNMYFGPDAQIRGDATREVKTISMTAMTTYHLHLKGISVAGFRLSIEPYIFEYNPRRGRGFFIDCGAPYTHLPASAYDPLKQAVMNYFSYYGWTATSSDRFPLCYDTYPNDDQSFPIVTLHFEHLHRPGEIDMDLGAENMFKGDDDDQEFCMAVMRGNDGTPALLGAFQQKNFKFLFDIYNSLFHFVPQYCELEN